MSNDDRTLAGDTSPNAPRRLGSLDRLATAAVETVLDIDEVMSQARLVERTAKICLRGDLQAEFDDLTEQLGDLVDADGRILSEGDIALADQGEAIKLNERIQELLAEMNKATRTIRFRAMPDDAWRAWEKAHQDSQGNYKDPDQANLELIAETAIAPTMSLDQVRNLRSKLGPTQMAAMANAAYAACTSGGVDVPKLRPFSPAPRQNPSGRN